MQRNKKCICSRSQLSERTNPHTINLNKEKMPPLCTDREGEKKVIAKQDRGTFLSQKGRFAVAHNSRWLI